MLAKLIRALWHSELEPLSTLDHLPVQLPQPDWPALREAAQAKHGKKFRCDQICNPRGPARKLVPTIFGVMKEQ